MLVKALGSSHTVGQCSSAIANVEVYKNSERVVEAVLNMKEINVWL